MGLDGTNVRICVSCTIGCSRDPSVYSALLELRNVFAFVVAALRSRPCRLSLSHARHSFMRKCAENKRLYSNVYVVQTTPYTCKSSALGALWGLCIAAVVGSIARLSTLELMTAPLDGRTYRILRR